MSHKQGTSPRSKNALKSPTIDLYEFIGARTDNSPSLSASINATPKGKLTNQQNMPALCTKHS